MHQTLERNQVPRRGSLNSRRRRLIPYLFLLPNLVIFGLFTIFPALRGFYISFFDSTDGRNFKYVGTANYKEIFSDKAIGYVASNTLRYVLGYVILSVIISLALSLLLNAQTWAKTFFRAIVFLPVLLSPVVVGLIWGNLFDRKRGGVNAIIQGLGFEQVPWLIDSKYTMFVVIFVGLWTHVGFFTVILLAGLQGIDKNIYEAAAIDGAHGWKLTHLITLPLLKPTTLVIIILATIQGFQSFDFIYTLTGGGPVGATTLIVQYIYDSAFLTPIRYGLASAAAVILFFIIFAVTILNYLIGRSKDAL
jgi:ABC-type sugar transport system permease subunit